MKKILLPIGLVIGFLVAAGESSAQDYKQIRQEIVKKQKNTRAEIETLTRQIQKYEERLKIADQKYEALYKKYQDLKHLIALQDQKLSKLQKEQSQIQDEIDVTTRSLEKKKEELRKLVDKHQETLRYLYKHGRTSQIAIILSSSSINNMLVRSFYLQKFNRYIDGQVTEIRKTQRELQQTKDQLQQAEEKNKSILAEIREEKSQLDEKKKQQEKNVAMLRQDRRQIQKQLSESQQQKERLNNTLSQLILQEEKIRKAQAERLRRLEEERKRKLAEARGIENDAERAREVAKYSRPIETGNFMSEARLKKLEISFAQNKGSLPWPVESRTVSEHFGRRRHPVYGTVTQNLGIEIVTDNKEPVKVVHSGYVIDIRPIPGYGDVVVVKHGRFITAYGNLSRIRVRKNEVLQQGDIIGLAGDETSPKGESLFFLIRENNSNLDPEQWLQSETVTSTY